MSASRHSKVLCYLGLATLTVYFLLLLLRSHAPAKKNEVQDHASLLTLGKLGATHHHDQEVAAVPTPSSSNNLTLEVVRIKRSSGSSKSNITDFLKSNIIQRGKVNFTSCNWYYLTVDLFASCMCRSGFKTTLDLGFSVYMY